MRHCHHAWSVDKAHDANTNQKRKSNLVRKLGGNAFYVLSTAGRFKS